MALSGGPVQIQNDPIYALPHLYLTGLQLSSSAGTNISVAPGAARDSNNVIDLIVGGANYQGNDYPVQLYNNYQPGLLINSLVNGVNGLDQGTIAASTQYAVYLIGDSRGYNPVAGLISLTSNQYPLMPAGYDSLRLIGFWETFSNSEFIYSDHKPQNIGGLLQYYNVPPISVLSGGDATSFTAIDLTASGAIPTTTLPNIIVGLLITFIPAAAGDYLQLRPTGSSATGGLPTIVGVSAGIAQSQYLVMIAGIGSSKPEIDYLVSSSSDSVSISVASWAGVSNSAYPALV